MPNHRPSQDPPQADSSQADSSQASSGTKSVGPPAPVLPGEPSGPPREVRFRHETRLRRKRRRRATQRALWVLFLVPLVLGGIVWLNVGFLLSAPQIQAHVSAALSERLNVEHRFERAHFSLLSGLVIENLEIDNPKGSRSPTAISVEEITVTLRLLDLLRGQLTVDEVRVRKPRIHVERLDSGQLNLLSDLAKKGSDQEASIELPAIDVQDLMVEICPDTIAPLEESIRVPRLKLLLPAESPGQYVIDGLLLVKGVRDVELRGRGRLDTGHFDGSVKVRRLQLDESVRNQIPEGYQQVWDKIQPHGLINLDLDFAVEDQQLSHWESRLEVIEGRISFTGVEQRIESLQGELLLTRHEAKTLGALTGIAGHGDAALDGSITFSEDKVEEINLTLTLDQVALGEELDDVLSGEFLGLWQQLSPTGRVGLKFQVQGDRLAVENVSSELILQGAEIRAPGLPYRIEALSGSITFNSGVARVAADSPLRGRIGSSAVTVWGDLSVPGEQSLDVHIGVEEFPLNRNLEDALPEFVREHYVQYGASGLIDADIWVHGDARDPEIGVVARAKNGSMRYHLFPYLVQNVTGEAHYQRYRSDSSEPFQHVITLKGLQGSHGSSSVFLDAGSIRWGPGPPKLDLRITSPGLAIEDDLLRALPESAQETVHSFHLEGELEATVEIFTRDPKDVPANATGLEGSSVEVRTTVAVTPGLRFEYEPLPYALELAGGKAIHNLTNGFIQFVELETNPEVGPRLLFDGAYQDDPDDPTRRILSLNRVEILAWKNGPGVPIDDKLANALPPSFKELLEGLQLSGHVSGKLSVTYKHGAGETAEERNDFVQYSGELTGHDLRVNFGLEFRELLGQIRFHGRSGQGEPPTFSGWGTVNHTRLSRFRIRDTKISFAYGFLQEAARRALNDEFKPPEGGKFVFPPELKERLRRYDLAKTLQVYVKEGDFYGGNIEGFIYVDSGGHGDFHVDIRTEGVQLSRGSQDIFREEGVEGELVGWTRFGGQCDQSAGIEGMGQFRIVNGKLKKLPVLAATIGAIASLNLNSLDDRTVDGVFAKFRMAEQAFIIDDWDDLVISSPALIMRGKGRMDFDQELYLFLEPDIVTDYVPVISQIFKSIKGIKLVGPLDAPVARWPVLYEDVFLPGK